MVQVFTSLSLLDTSCEKSVLPFDTSDRSQYFISPTLGKLILQSAFR